MRLFVNVKALGKLRASVEQVPFDIDGRPEDVRGLIIEVVAACVAQFEKRAVQGEVLAAMTADEIADRAMSGKIAFGELTGESNVQLQQAQQNALQCFEDGIYRIFLDGQPLEELDQKIELNEQSQLTFVRLTMLAGRLW